MAKVMVLQHVAYELLGTLDPLLRANRHRIRYINFGRDPHAKPNVADYDALIVLGGPMNVDEAHAYPHIQTEIETIQTALSLDKPILGICLGAQLLAAALGSGVGPAEQKELGWHLLSPTSEGLNDPLIAPFGEQQHIFQWHGHTYETPGDAVPLVTGHVCENQAFRYGDKAYGFQFHLEIERSLIQRWLSLQIYQDDLAPEHRAEQAKAMLEATDKYIEDSVALSQQVFANFLKLFPGVNRHVVLPSR